MKYLITIISVALLILTSCLKEKASPIVEPVEPVEPIEFPCGDTVYFEASIMGEIINSHCTGCHTSGGNLGGYSFDTYDEIVDASTEILATINHEYSPMPQGSPKLNDSLITLFDCWIQQGKLNN